MSTDIISPALRLFDEPVVDRSIERLQYAKIAPAIKITTRNMLI